MKMPRFALFILPALACWPVLAWYGRGSFDGSNEPWGLLALVTAALVVWRAPPAAPPRQPLLLPSLFLLIYSLASLAGVPIALRAMLAALAMTALASAWYLGRRLDLPLLALALLALPLTA